MKYPEFLRKGDLIGVCAPSAGVGRKLESFDRSLGTLRAEGYRIRETASVRLDSDRGGNAQTRGDELNELFADPEVKMVMAASGAELAELYGMESGTTYQVMLIAGEDAVPLCLSERNSLQ